jgi:hypothetical protein
MGFFVKTGDTKMTEEQIEIKVRRLRVMLTENKDACIYADTDVAFYSIYPVSFVKADDAPNWKVGEQLYEAAFIDGELYPEPIILRRDCTLAQAMRACEEQYCKRLKSSNETEINKKQMKSKIKKLKDAMIRALLMNMSDDDRSYFIHRAIEEDDSLRDADDDSIRDIFKDKVLAEFDRIENTDPKYNYDIAVALYAVISGKLLDFMTKKMGPIK